LKEKRSGDKEARFPGGEQLELKELSPSVSFCWFLLLEHWVAVLCLDQVMKVHVLHFQCCRVGVG
jgi:hypothetical protein